MNAAPLRDAATRSDSAAVRSSSLRSFILNGEISGQLALSLVCSIKGVRAEGQTLVPLAPSTCTLLQRQSLLNLSDQHPTHSSLSLSLSLSFIFFPPVAGRYNDFTQGWYEDVGVPILILMLISLANPVLTLWADQVTLHPQPCLE